MKECIYKTTHTYSDGRPVHVFTTTVVADTVEKAMNYIKTRYDIKDGYKSVLEVVNDYEMAEK